MKSDNELISVIVPVYNVEKYLSRCIESIINQTYKNLEIILVDDGSPDNSGKICDEYALKDDRIRVIHKQNGGVAGARNLGIDFSDGKYITFIDSDDYVELNMIEIMYDNMRSDLDLVSVGHRVIYDNGVVLEKKNDNPLITEIEINDTYNFSAFYNSYISWAVLYRKNIIGNVRFNKKFFVGEDTLFYYTVLKQCNKIIYINKPLYNYVIYHQSAKHGEIDEKKLTELTAWGEVVKLYSDFKHSQKTCCGEYLIRCFSKYQTIYKSKKNMQYLKPIAKKIRKYYIKGIMKVKGKKNRILISLIAISPKLHHFLYKLKSIKGDDIT